MRYLIVGVDVGTTSAAAVLGFDGQVAGLKSARGFGVDDIVAFIRDYGIPAVVACDVSPPPKAVSRVASSFGANLFEPDVSLSVDEKLVLTRQHTCGNPHERDALAAALNAYRKLKNLLIKADSLGLSPAKKYDILKGGRIKDRLERKVKEKVEKPAQKPRFQSPEEKKTRILEKRVKTLKKELEDKNAETTRLMEELRLAQRSVSAEIARDAELSRVRKAYNARGNRIRQLEAELAKSSQFTALWNRLLAGEVVPVPVFPQVKDGFSYMPNKIRDSDKAFLKDARLVFTDNKSNKKILDDAGIPYASEQNVKRFRGCLYAKSRALTEAKEIKLENLVEEYRSKRKTQVT
ncbi:MAG: DUF460 domain-containing protein [Candidatus Altiarchaeota archaeon]